MARRTPLQPIAWLHRPVVAVAGRVLLCACALAAALWLAGNLRSMHRAEEGVATLSRAVQTGASPQETDRAHRELVAARRFNDDTDLLVREAAVLVLLGRSKPLAAAEAREAARREPSNFTAWVTLLLATRGRDPATAALARRKAERLDPSLRPRLQRLDPGGAP